MYVGIIFIHVLGSLESSEHRTEALNYGVPFRQYTIYNYILLVKFSMGHSLIFVALLNSDHFFFLNRDNDPLRNSMQFFSALYRHFTIWLRYSQCFFAVIHSKFMTQIFHVEISCFFFFNISSTFPSNHNTAFVSKHLFSQLFHH